MEGDDANRVSILSELRLLVFLRRIAIAQERLAADSEERLAHDREQWRRNTPRIPRPTEFASFDVEEANRRWRAEQEAAEYGGIVEDTQSQPQPQKQSIGKI